MSMIANLRRLSDGDLARLFAKPERILDYLNAQEPLDDFGPFADTDLDKAWHAIHFLLCGDAWEGPPPLNFIVSGGTEIGEEDVGYGPARGLPSSAVAEIARELSAISRETLLERFDPHGLIEAEIYPQIWDRPPEEDDTRAYVGEYYEELVAFVESAARAGEALVVFIS